MEQPQQKVDKILDAILDELEDRSLTRTETELLSKIAAWLMKLFGGK